MTTDGGATICRMKASEWAEIASTIRERWPAARIPGETIARWGDDCADLPGVHVALAVDVLYREGREYPPHGGQIRAKVVELAIGAPSWGEALRLFRNAFGRPTSCIDATREPDDDGLGRAYPRREYLEAHHPLLLGFAQAVGWDQIAAAFAGGSDEARAREKWNAHVARATREGTLAGLPDGGLRELRRINGPARAEPRRAGAGIAAARARLGAGDPA